ncbi:MAG: hypothetical protein IIC84_07540 [Chloroflexi bacterium]|nr:hypothetical protein [Chloroflexota bacterium]
MKALKYLPFLAVFTLIAAIACSAAETPAAQQQPQAPAPASAAVGSAQTSPSAPEAPAAAAMAATVVPIDVTQAIAPSSPDAAAPRIIPEIADTVKMGGTMKWALEAPVKAIDPVWTTATVTFRVSSVIYDSLMRLGLDGSNQNNAFESWEVSDDQLNWTFNLREDMSFSDGTPLTTDDVIASTFRWADRITSGIALFDRTVAGNNSAESMEKVDDYTFIMHLSEPYPITSLGFQEAPFIYKAEIAGAVSSFDRIEEHIASGPWALANWTPAYRFDFEARPEWTGRVPEGESVWMDKLQIIEIPDKTTMLAGLKTGKLDYATSPGGELLQSFKDDDKLEFFVFPGGGTGVLLFNWTKEPFNNVNMRRSMQAAMNMEQYQAAYGPQELWQLCPAIFVCGTPNESHAGEELYDQRDLAKAKELFELGLSELAAAGSDFTRDTSIKVMGNTSYTQLRDHSIVSADILRQIGFNVDHEMPDWATAVTFRQDPTYWDIFHTGCCDVPTNNPVQNWWISPGTYGWIDVPEIEELRREYTRQKDHAGELEVIDKIQTIYYDLAVQPTYGTNQIYHGWRTYVKGVHDFHRNTRMTNTWLDK